MNCKTCGQEVKKRKTVKFKAEFVKIEPGEFLMGGPPDEEGRFDDEVQHRVMITKAFELQTTPVTQSQYEVVMGVNPSRFKGENNPVEMVSWNDAQEFIKRLNAGQTKYTYRLPTEAEWEYAARAGTSGPYPFNTDELDAYAWYDKNSDGKTHPVGQKKPNAWGLYDMHGNVWEWCQDWYRPYPARAANEPQGPSIGSRRVIRGGSWGGYPRYLRSARRRSFGPGLRDDGVGFRLVRSRK